ncbi:hypothetical protein NUW54_g9907 [Trametes sanguinea]|uniref:Uncharacterized protein n=1 Tax=Trametes sanguinea TaxID=158606 RepID=A0ACC1P2S3_9APHY|nr:hypothetical protein NUW54_g9907 [Trametes sanguinea]
MSLESDQQLAVGSSIPPFTSHAISVSLPTWVDNVEYEEGTKRVVEAMVTGYPRFFIHRSIQKLAGICEQKFGVHGERCMLFPTRKIAEQCREFMIDRSTKAGSPVPVRLVQFTICPDVADPSAPCQELHIVFFPGDQFPLAKQFWQHAGLGISSRRAERCLSLLQELMRRQSKRVSKIRRVTDREAGFGDAGADSPPTRWRQVCQRQAVADAERRVRNPDRRRLDQGAIAMRAVPLSAVLASSFGGGLFEARVVTHRRERRWGTTAVLWIVSVPPRLDAMVRTFAPFVSGQLLGFYEQRRGRGKRCDVSSAIV